MVQTKRSPSWVWKWFLKPRLQCCCRVFTFFFQRLACWFLHVSFSQKNCKYVIPQCAIRCQYTSDHLDVMVAQLSLLQACGFNHPFYFSPPLPLFLSSPPSPPRWVLAAPRGVWSPASSKRQRAMRRSSKWLVNTASRSRRSSKKSARTCWWEDLVGVLGEASGSHGLAGAADKGFRSLPLLSSDILHLISWWLRVEGAGLVVLWPRWGAVCTLSNIATALWKAKHIIAKLYQTQWRLTFQKNK